MFQKSFILPVCLLVMGVTAWSDILVTARLHPEEYLKKGESLQLDLRDFFQTYPDPGPVATFSFRLPQQEGIREIGITRETDVFGDPVLDTQGRFIPVDDPDRMFNIMTYKLASGGIYNNFYAVHPDDFLWQDYSIQFQLLASDAPITVSNFMTYADTGAYTDTIIHRSEIDVLQGGGWTHTKGGDFLLDTIEGLPPIPLERTRMNEEGTIAMARRNEPDSATSQFFMNVADNTQGFSDNYSVFGELVNPDSAMPLLKEMQDVTIWNYGGAFASLPIYAGYLDNVESWIHFNSVTVSEGDAEGVSYSWEFLDFDGDGTTSQRESSHQAVFDISIEAGQLRITRHDSGEARIRVTGSKNNQNTSFDMELVGYNREALQAFPGSVLHTGGFIDIPWYGWVVAEQYPYLQHLNHGYQYLLVSFADPPAGDDYYFYDFNMDSWFYTKEILYPYLYVYSLQAWVWYVEESGNGSDPNRWFNNLSNGEWFQN